MSQSNDPLTLLKHDHETVKKLFKSAEKSNADQEDIFEQIKTALQIHTTIEEEIFYPAVAKMQSDSAKGEVREAKHEHTQVKQLLKKMAGMEPDDEKFEATFKELQQDVEHHVEEEETEMFPDVRKHMEKSELTELGQQLGARKQELEKSEGKSEARESSVHQASK